MQKKPTLWLQCLIAALIWCNSTALIAQKGKTTGPGVGMDKVELLYRDVLITQQSSNGHSYSYNSKWPYARINGGEPLEIDRNASALEKSLKGCKPAVKELHLYSKERKSAVNSLLLGIGGAVVLGSASVLVPAAINPDDPPAGLFFTGLGLTFGSALTGYILAAKHNKRSKQHLEQAVVKYNASCYKAPAPDTSAPKPAAVVSPANTSKPESAAPSTGIVEHYKDTAYVDIIRDAPGKTNFWTIGLIPLNMDFSSSHYLSFRVGGELQYHHPKFSVRADLKYAVVDNFHADGYTGEKYVADPYIEYEQGKDVVVPDDYQKGIQGTVLAWFTLKGVTTEKEESVYLGTSASYGQQVDNFTQFKVKTYKTWSARVGASYYRSVQQSENAVDLRTDEPPITVIDPSTGETYTYDLYDESLDYGVVMLRSTYLSAGIGRRKVGDLKFNLKNTKTKGIKESTTLSEWYVDVLYAPSVKLGRIDFFDFTSNPDKHTLHNISVDPTPINHLGARVGYRFEGIKKRAGWGYQIEIGSRPGIKNQFDPWFNTYVDTGLLFFFGGR